MGVYKYYIDKNPDSVDECTRQFREVQQAYDVLSDPQERAWLELTICTTVYAILHHIGMTSIVKLFYEEVCECILSRILFVKEVMFHFCYI